MLYIIDIGQCYNESLLFWGTGYVTLEYFPADKRFIGKPNNISLRQTVLSTPN